jgi:2-(1,2-epoxy-1,2-dihydrophenyl)acetyl-CoA isomerase
MNDEPLKFEITGQVATVTLNRPQRRNALAPDMRALLAEAIARVAADRQVRSLILTGAGGAFCAGGDLEGIKGMGTQPADAMRQRMRDGHAWFTQLCELEVPVIAAVDGPAYGAGFSLALAADLILATPAARFCMAFVRLGLVPDCGAAHLLPRAVGIPRAKELIFSGRELGAAEARAIGLVLEIHEPAQLMARAREMAAAFVHASPCAMGMTKQMLNRSFETDLRGLLATEALAQGVAMTSEHARASIAAVADGHKPAFRWPAHKG